MRTRLLISLIVTIILLSGCPPREPAYEKVLGDGPLQAKTDSSVTLGGIIYEKPYGTWWTGAYELWIGGSYRLTEFRVSTNGVVRWRIDPLDAEATPTR